MKHLTLIPFLIFFAWSFHAQGEKTPQPYYYEIPEAPDTYTAGNAIGRMVDGLGFRFYWATEGLLEADLNYKPTDSSRSSRATIDHIYGLSKVVLNATKKTITDFTVEPEELSYQEKRQAILDNIKEASLLLKAADAEEMQEFKIVFKSRNGNSEFPFWNNINGPIADAIWHTGQVVLLRRASGNPFNSKVSVLQGKVRK